MMTRQGQNNALARRMAARAETAATDRDLETLARFRKDVQAALRVVRAETADLDGGRHADLPSRAAEKAGVLAAIEAAAPLVEPFLPDIGDAALRDDLAALGQALEENAGLLARKADAAARVGAELRKVRDRHGLAGLYGKTGHKRGASPDGRRVDSRL